MEETSLKITGANKSFLNKNDSKLTFATEGIFIHNGYIGRHIRNTSRCQCIRPT